MASNSDLLLISGNANRPLAEEIAGYLNVELGDAEIGRFGDGEVKVKLCNVRDTDLFIINPTQPAAEHLIELLITIDAARRSSALKITAVIPYFGYGRQDRKDEPRVPISGKLMARLIETAGAHRVICVDLHAGQTQGFFDIPMDHIYVRPLVVSYFRGFFGEPICCAFPDAGAAKDYRSYAGLLKADRVIGDKEHLPSGEVRITEVVGDPQGKVTLIIDDIAGSAKTLVAMSKKMDDMRAKEVWGAIVHPILYGDAAQRIIDSPIKTVITTNTVPIKPEIREVLGDRLRIVSTAPLLGEVIRHIHEGDSVTALFDEEGLPEKVRQQVETAGAQGGDFIYKAA